MNICNHRVDSQWKHPKQICVLERRRNILRKPTRQSVCVRWGVFYLESSTQSGYISQTPGDQRSNFPHLPLQELINKILITSRLILETGASAKGLKRLSYHQKTPQLWLPWLLFNVHTLRHRCPFYIYVLAVVVLAVLRFPLKIKWVLTASTKLLRRPTETNAPYYMHILMSISTCGPSLLSTTYRRWISFCELLQKEQNITTEP